MSDFFTPAIQNSLQIPNRRAWLEIAEVDKDNKISFKKLEGLNISFNIESVGYVFTQASFSIFNLNQENIDRLINFFYIKDAVAENKIIRFYAGYDDNVMCLFEGYVVQTTMTEPPDIGFNFNAIFRYDAFMEKPKISLTNQVTTKQVFEEVAKILNVSLDYQATYSKTLKNFVFDGNVQQLIAELKQLDNNIDFCFVNNYQNTSTGSMRVYDAVTAPDRKIPTWEKEYKLSAKTGLLGVPQFDVYGANIKCVLSPQFAILDKIELNSLYQKAGNGKYYITKITHTGELRGNKFETRLAMRTAEPRNQSS
jgi:hypothetical protein